jgi:acetyltransferase-like isoleucine patch superfamily enzyme
MLSEQDRHDRDAARRAFRQWWDGDRGQPFVLQHCLAYHICDVLFPTWRADLAFHLRFVAMSIIARVPWSPLKVRLFRCMGVRIGSNVYIAPGVFLDAFYPRLIAIEDDCFLGIGCRILVHEYTARGFRLGRVRIGRGSVVGAWSILRSGVTLGPSVTTGLGSVVVHDVPEGATVGGVPARPLSAKEGRC